MNDAGTKLCVAGTMDDYAAIVSRSTFGYKLIQGVGTKPYWSTNSADGNHCFVSWSGTDTLSAISYGSEKEVARIQVGDHPAAGSQRRRPDRRPASIKRVALTRALASGPMPAASPLAELADHRLQ
jgi:hypothetical protein